MKMLFISHGNIPSRWAHSVQMMKMADAFSRLVPDFRILTQANWSRTVRPKFDYQRFYGLASNVRVAHLHAFRQPWGPVVDYVYARGFMDRAANYAISGGFDLVFTRAPEAAALCVQGGVPCIVETHSTTSREKLDALVSIRHHEKLLGVVTISDVIRKQLVAADIPDEKICVWPDAVDLSAFTRLPGRDALRQHLKLPLNATIATYCGHLYKHRGVEEILTAATKLPHIHFLFVGGWKKDVRLRQKESAHMSNVTFTGFRENRLVPAYLTASDVLLMPYSSQCKTADQMSPMKMFEYMAAARPIVATDLPALRQHLRHDSNCLLVPADSGSALAEAVARITTTPVLAKAISEQARRDVRPYSWDRRATQILDQFVKRGHKTVPVSAPEFLPAQRKAA